ncbi:MAG: hypothetical protein KGJ37_04635, partial [Verrucomicrobiota bacterium]|nr:hypothetical protein [Verrucomicrobiota bacterium]
GSPAVLISVRKDVTLPKNGSPVEVSLKTGKVVSAGAGDLKFECWTDDTTVDAKRHYSWRCRISVPEGGLIQRTAKLDFEAPEGGYQPSIEINMPIMSEPWYPDFEGEYFVKLRDGSYARAVISVATGGDHFATITSFLNPTGSRNLEAGPDQMGNPR